MRTEQLCLSVSTEKKTSLPPWCIEQTSKFSKNLSLKECKYLTCGTCWCQHWGRRTIHQIHGYMLQNPVRREIGCCWHEHRLLQKTIHIQDACTTTYIWTGADSTSTKHGCWKLLMIIDAAIHTNFAPVASFCEKKHPLDFINWIYHDGKAEIQLSQNS